MIGDSLGLVKTAQDLAAAGLLPGTSGNLSIRTRTGFLITPSGASWRSLEPSDLVDLQDDGSPLRARRAVPSSEWRIHCDIYARRPDVNAVVHTHSRFATIISCLRKPIPAVHYMIAVSGASVVRCAEYATYGTPELSAKVLATLGETNACLLANHGLVSLGASLSDATRVACELENVAAIYWHALQIGQPVILDDAEIQRVADKFKSSGYGKAR